MKDSFGGIISIQGDSLEIINEQMKSCSCKIECNDKAYGSGFFCLVPFPNKIHLLPVLMTNYHVLKKEYIMKGKKVNINLRDKKISILIDDSRRIFTDELYDITIIEMKENDGLDFNNFLEIDDSIHKNNFEEYFKNRSVYLIHHPKSVDEAEFAVGIIKSISIDTNVINHTCKSDPGSSGSPILDLKTNKIIGIHKSKSNHLKWNAGTFIKEPIEKFYKECGNKIKSDEILIGNPKKDNEITNINNNNSQNKDNISSGKNVKSELKSYNINKIQNINDIANNNLSDNNNDNEFSLFNQENNNYKKDDLIEKNKYKDNDNNNNNIGLKNEQVLYNNIYDESKMNNYKNIKDVLGNVKDNSMNVQNPNIIDEITIKYKKQNANAADYILKLQLYGLKETSSSDKLFGEHFVSINEDFCKIIIGNKEYELKSYLNKECDEVNKNEFEIKLKGISKITELTCMFCGCFSLDSIEGFSNINTSKITRLSHLFSFCKVTSIPDISKWDTSNVKFMDNMFLHCFNLKSLPDISKWNTSNVKNIMSLFGDCKSLKYIPDISKWDTNNIEYMAGLFAGCHSLQTLPDISNWKTRKVNAFKYIFYDCRKLVTLPDISKWDTSNVTDMSFLFCNCESLEYLPDISGWNTSKVTTMNNMFTNCKSLVFLPDISQWNTSNVQDMFSMFSYCNNLLELPDISKWDINNVQNKANMFFNCNKNLNIPEKFKLNPISNLFGLYSDGFKSVYDHFKYKK